MKKITTENVDQRDFDTTSVNSEPSAPQVDSVADLSISNEEKDSIIFKTTSFYVTGGYGDPFDDIVVNEFVPKISLKDICICKDISEQILRLVHQMYKSYFTLSIPLHNKEPKYQLEIIKTCVKEFTGRGINIYINSLDLMKNADLIFDNHQEEYEVKIIENIQHIEGDSDGIISLYYDLIDWYDRWAHIEKQQLQNTVNILFQIYSCCLKLSEINLDSSPDKWQR